MPEETNLELKKALIVFTHHQNRLLNFLKTQSKQVLSIVKGKTKKFPLVGLTNCVVSLCFASYAPQLICLHEPTLEGGNRCGPRVWRRLSSRTTCDFSLQGLGTSWVCELLKKQDYCTTMKDGKEDKQLSENCLQQINVKK